MSLHQSHNRISQAWAEINRRFTRSQDEWNDEVREQFERDYWQELHHDMPIYLQALGDLVGSVQQARQNVR